MKEHPHAEFLRAIADGESLDGWEYKNKPNDPWDEMQLYTASSVLYSPDLFEVRRKQKMLSINGHEFPEPMKDEPSKDHEYWIASSVSDGMTAYFWQSEDFEIRWLKRGVLHKTKEAAEAHRRAIILASGGTL